MRKVLDVVSRIACTESTVFLQGESGTGKEIVAKAIHLASTRRNKPFVPSIVRPCRRPCSKASCFGHEKGSFTGANRSTKGLLSQAHEGTIFLDEIGDMPPSLQANFCACCRSANFIPWGARSRFKSMSESSPQP